MPFLSPNQQCKSTEGNNGPMWLNIGMSVIYIRLEISTCGLRKNGRWKRSSLTDVSVSSSAWKQRHRCLVKVCYVNDDTASSGHAVHLVVVQTFVQRYTHKPRHADIALALRLQIKPMTTHLLPLWPWSLTLATPIFKDPYLYPYGLTQSDQIWHVGMAVNLGVSHEPTTAFEEAWPSVPQFGGSYLCQIHFALIG